MNQVIRELREEDIKNGLLETLENLSSCEGLSIGDAEKIYRDITKDKMYNIFIAIVDEEIVGVATVLIEQKFIHNGGKVAHIEDVVIKSDYQGNGIGSGLIKKLIEVAKEQGCYKIILNCSVENKKFYSNLGFSEHSVGMRIDL